MRRAFVVALAVILVTSPVLAQDGGHRFPRRWLIAGVGTLVAGSAVAIYAANFEGDIGGCSSVQCVAPITLFAGAMVGFMIGSESDKLYNLRYAHAPPWTLRGVELPLTVVPTDLSLGARTVFVSGDEGVELVRAGPSLERLGMRARGLRGIGAVTADSVTNIILVGTGVGLYQFPLRNDAPGSLAYPGDISAISADGSITAIGLGPDFLLARHGDSLEAIGDPIAEISRVVDLVWQGNRTLWVLTEDRLASYEVRDGVSTLSGEFALPAVGRRMALGGDTAYVAAGSGGVYAIDISDHTALVQLANWSGVRFAYDVATAAGRVYVAAGPEGLYVTRLDGDRFVPIGLAREAGFVAAVESDGESVYLLDRTGGTLRRIPVEPGR
ncbi:MAG TPA: hypothetical protein VGA37_03775 [Gemmatimonadales bacterium]